MNQRQGWGLPILVAIIVHAAILIFPINLEDQRSEKRESVVTFKLTTPSPQVAAPRAEAKQTPKSQILPQPKAKPKRPKPKKKKRIIKETKQKKPVPMAVLPEKVEPDSDQPEKVTNENVSTNLINVQSSEDGAAQQSSSLIKLSSEELLLVCPEMNEPHYPMVSRQFEEYGTAVIEIELNKKGSVVSTRIIKSSGYERLDKAAVAAIATWKCDPPLHNGQTVNAVAQQPFDFELE